jgi:hypothetical protein
MRDQSYSLQYNRKIIENDNLESFMVDLYIDKKTIGCNIRLLSECLVEWQNTRLELDGKSVVESTDTEFAEKM